MVAHASGPDSSVFDNGLPLGPTSWIRDGSLAALISSRHSAAIAGVPVTPGIDTSPSLCTLQGPGRRRWSR